MKFKDKRFLTDHPSESGSIVWGVSVDYEDYYFVSSELRISDCGSSIHLDFDCSSPKHLQKRIDKLDNLLESLNKMRAALLEVQSADVAKNSKKFYY